MSIAIDEAQSADEFLSAVVPLTHVDVRGPEQNPDNTWTMSGYAAVKNQQAVYLDSKWLKVLVEFAPTAFDEVLSSQKISQPDGVVHFNLGHDMNRAVAATNVPAGQPGSLQLASDAHGLRYLAKVSKDDPDGLALATKMRDGVISQASLAFTVGEQEITETETDDGPDIILRRITSVASLFDVCACPQGVFSQTVSELQSFARPLMGHSFAGAPAGLGHPGQPSEGGPIVVSPEAGGSVDEEAWQREVAEMRRTLAQLRR